ncbi:hypothetical protein GUITHDRAFT_139803 [Guillardia theta CCMP2712]|uniref:SMP-30/Gluconolactonase/LRE-like region domain-containing protein n=1 Tax=Guillardia theta (strain CCMP2712) TaxID=905079 RepID=L1J815_GUITC|nr:hypothetical protein GUITHDRAFT_139803 [Guillardia theta CCMP2712]EKX44239.1 hypothetical protein GUITHDRAFT_139803 [Guillardia theta CCMP2712]|eukprot:XP_005831219.1 hypothetical protein GUITHDRAFT_139803 [Guillardia theta CCMP2712]
MAEESPRKRIKIGKEGQEDEGERDPIRSAVECKCILGESPVWDEDLHVLYFVDINGKKVHSHSPKDGSFKTWELEGEVGCVVPGPDRRRVYAAVVDSIFEVDVEKEGKEAVRKLATLPEGECPSGFRFNDGKCDPQGRLWIGTMNKQWRDEKAPRGKLYVLDKDGKFRTSDGRTTFEWNDMVQETWTVSRFDYDDKDGSIEVGSRKEVVKIPTAGDGGGVPDGMTIDADGLLWVTLGEGGAVAQYDAETGEEVQRFKLPVKRPTACTFGGEDLQELYITTREETGQEPSAAAGHLLVAKLDKSKGHAAAWRCKAI